MEEKLVGILVIFGGIFCAGAAIADWEFFMRHPKAWLFVKMFGRNGARIFYVIFGVALLIFGVLMATGILQSNQ